MHKGINMKRKRQVKDLVIKTKCAMLLYQLPDDSYEFKLAQNAGNYLYALDEISNWLRSNTKHGISSELLEEISRSVNENDIQITDDAEMKAFIEVVLYKVRDKVEDIRSQYGAHDE